MESSACPLVRYDEEQKQGETQTTLPDSHVPLGFMENWCLPSHRGAEKSKKRIATTWTLVYRTRIIFMPGTSCHCNVSKSSLTCDVRKMAELSQASLCGWSDSKLVHTAIRYWSDPASTADVRMSMRGRIILTTTHIAQSYCSDNQDNLASRMGFTNHSRRWSSCTIDKYCVCFLA
ncbi:hypothetical protein EDD85DRAFT_84621 [Armillaria nabsnona]|nr:hypothetical protein EDD85DRAFT_84621 [Armillaria nabsnona]